MKILLFANTDWYLFNFRLPLARTLCEQGHQVVLVSPGGEYGNRLRAMGYLWEPFQLSRRGANPFSELVAMIRLQALYRKENPDLVHHFTIKCVLYGSMAARLAGSPAVVNAITGLGYVFINRELPARLLNLLVRPFYRFALRGSRVIFQNPDDQAAFLTLGLVKPGQSSLVRGSGVDLERYLPQPEPAGTPLVVLPARFLWDKGLAEFVQAARMVKAQGLQVRFALVGDTDPSNPASVPPSQLDAWQKEGLVECWGWQEDMASVIAQAHIICLPSYREGLPRALLEAGACQRAVVTSDVPGCREVVRQGENGLLVPPRDAPALASALQRLVIDPGLRKELARRGREIVVKEFSASQIASETVAIYQKILEGQASS